MIDARLSSSDDSGLRIDSGDLLPLVEISGPTLCDFDLFNEEREGFSYEEDAERCVRLLDLKLEVLGYRVSDEYYRAYEQMVKTIVSPGPGFEPTTLVITLVPLNEPNC